MQRGYIKVYRKIMESGLLQMPNTLAVFMHILLNATYKDIKVGTKSGVVLLKRGQYISGRTKLAKDLEQTEQQIRTSLERLVNLDILTINSTSRYSIYTIEKYDIYQDNNLEATSQTTNKQPTDNQQTTTKQEVNKLRNKEINTPKPPNGDFELFWNHYPKKVGKEAARKAYEKANPILVLIIEALEWQKQSDQWKKNNGQFIPNPSTYLNQARWLDEKPQSVFNQWLGDVPVEYEVIPSEQPLRIAS